MKCPIHNDNNISTKCKTCEQYLCQKCVKDHQKMNHFIKTTAEISSEILDSILDQINRLKDQIKELQSNISEDTGLQIIQRCQREVQTFIDKTFQQLKANYRSVIKDQWRIHHSDIYQKIDQRIQFLQGWNAMILKHPIKAILFETQPPPQDMTIKQPREITLPKIVFNQLLLRRASSSISNIISLSRHPGKKLNVPKIESMVKFMQGTSVMFEYSFMSKNIKKVQFRQFVTPMRSESIQIDNQIFLIGGQNKLKKPSKEIWIYEKSYNIMRIVAMMSKGRVGHCLVRSQDYVYIFGGKDACPLERLNIKNKSLDKISDWGRPFVGCSGILIQNQLYFFGGTFPHEINKSIIIYSIDNGKWEQIQPLNPMLYEPSINALVAQLSSTEVLIMGGYKQWKEYSYSKLITQVYNIQTNYFSNLGKGENPFCLTSNGENVQIINSTLVSLCNLKKSVKAHGPNLPCILTYFTKQDKIQIDMILPL